MSVFYAVERQACVTEGDKQAAMDHEVPETKLDGEVVFSGRLLTVRKDRVALAGGGVTSREVVLHPGAVALAAVDGDGNFIFVRQYRYPVGVELWEVPAGKLEPGEEPFRAAHRELAEETGLAATMMQPLTVFFTTPGFCDEKMHLFLATGLGPARPSDIRPDDDEFIEVERVPLDEAVLMAVDGRIKDAKTIAAIFLARAALCQPVRPVEELPKA